jgi:cysteine synthase A
MKYKSIIETIGNTPIIEINRLFPTHQVFIKLEKTNPTSSIKDRIAMAMVEDAEKSGALKPGMTVIEPTSGNTGIALAMVCAVKGYPLILVMPESMSIERRKMMSALGAQFELTPKEKGIKGAVDRAKELKASTALSWMPMQFDNKSNLRIHEETTAQEILKDFPEGLDYLITGVGTGGHITSCAKVLKKHFPNLKVIAVEPADSPVLSGGNPGPHAIQGRSLIDEVITITKDEAFAYTKQAAKLEGLFCGISTGAALAAVSKKIPIISQGKKVLTFCYDTGERYHSVPGLFE